MRKEITDTIYDEIVGLGIFKKTYKNIVPMWAKIPSFPAVAVIYDSETVERYNNNHKAIANGKVGIYIYNHQSPSEYEDNLSEFIDEVQKVIEENKFLSCNLVECIVSEIKRDGGIIHPYSMAQIIVSVKYIKTLK